MDKLILEDFGAVDEAFTPEQSAEDFHAQREAMRKVLTPVGAAYSAAKAFADALNKLNGEVVQEDVLTELVMYQLTPEMRMRLAFATLTGGNQNEELDKHDKTFAVELAADKGPDWCQWLYKFAVFCTKAA